MKKKQNMENKIGKFHNKSFFKKLISPVLKLNLAIALLIFLPIVTATPINEGTDLYISGTTGNFVDYLERKYSYYNNELVEYKGELSYLDDGIKFQYLGKNIEIEPIFEIDNIDYRPSALLYDVNWQKEIKEENKKYIFDFGFTMPDVNSAILDSIKDTLVIKFNIKSDEKITIENPNLYIGINKLSFEDMLRDCEHKIVNYCIDGKCTYQELNFNVSYTKNETTNETIVELIPYYVEKNYTKKIGNCYSIDINKIDDYNAVVSVTKNWSWFNSGDYISIDPYFIDDTSSNWTAGTFVNTTWNDTYGHVGNVTLNYTGIPTGLISYWKLDESSGNALDAHGAYPGTVSGATQGAGGKINTAYDFEASESDKVDFNDVPIDGLNAFTFSAWINIESYGGGLGGIFSKFTSAGTDTDLIMDYVAPYSKIIAVTRNGAGGYGTTTSTFNLATWYHVVMVYNGSGATNADKLKIYINSVSDTLAFTNNIPSTLADTGTSDFLIGDYSTDHYYFDGIIDEVGVWNRALSSTEVTQLYNSGNGLVYSRYYSSGNFTSQVFNAGSYKQWKNLKFKMNIPSGTNITFYARSCASNPCTESWSSGHLETSSGIGNFILNTTITPNNQYLQYYTWFQTSDTSLTPVLEWVNISYTGAPTGPSVTTTLTSPADQSIDEDGSITFSCSATATNSVLVNMTLYYNVTGTFSPYQTQPLSGTQDSETFGVTLADGTNILWNCLAYNNATNSSFAANNWTVRISLPPPEGDATLLSLQGKVTNSTNGLVDDADLTAVVVNTNDCNAGGNNLIYNYTYTNIIQNGIFSVLLGEDSSLILEYNKDYYMCTYVDNELVGSAQKFRGGQGEIGGEDIESNVNLNNVTLGTTSNPTKLQFFSPDGSPTCCGPNNSDVWSCTAGYC